MTLSRHNLVRNLGAKPNDVRPMPEQGKRLLGSPDRTGKCAGLVNPLNPLPADVLDNMEQAIDERDFGRFGNKETGFKTAAHNAALSTRSDSATGHFGERSFAGTLIQINLTARREAPRELATRRVVAPITPAGSLSPPDTP